MNVGPVNVWFDWVPLFTLKVIPRLSFFNGGKYWKFSIYWLRYLLEFSGPKKDKKVYKEITSQELNKILSELE